MNAYHSALAGARQRWPAVSRFECAHGVAFQHDIALGLPAEMQTADVLYADLPWQQGWHKFASFAGVDQRARYRDAMRAVGRAVRAAGVPVVMVTGRHAVELLPVVVIDKPINDRMASTVRHNRARGKHSVAGMANMVFKMLENGWTDEAICAEIGVTVDELVRLKHVTGFSKLFENADYRRSWETKRQIELRHAYMKEHPDEAPHRPA